ncbi:methyltransferase domain-containing protein [Rhizobium laguerreae]|uniref:Phosphatidylethanolamine N-methyltransferase /phosphatidyl-N-methylethanolamine N-methyltransferase n=1 Tax=Rhizobium laguerreae TaxID=1076926 RepID=A0AAX2QP20_9HYPH|nr:class I SAM-dependent methyltransferase [Rhizobium laguerreae]MBY3138547.1 methyltransferase domain-containing protein [Rhizobium laguerreae]MBY3167406.1 methyltransferase domain-containing protein [Rhizobium laguerreae]MBY3195320.1 methyltransferase domain-containing protein [Rhizobium laguerreae]MBY3223233.1 methyltransferase domain-containing protein [Rhizobium laguerreae]MBY3230118.1 methyltransferase domain-containing protein [Rhizobium laguerreae]
MSLRVKVKERFGKRFDDEIRFFRGMMQGPKTVGSIVPTSSITAKRMASVVDIHSGLPVLELGPGTGAITKAILGRGVRAENLVAIEYSTDFHKHLQRTYPGVHFINGDAFDLQTTLGSFSGLTFDSVVSGIPLLNFPMAKRISLLESLLDRLPAGRPMVQISYGAISPIAANPDRYHIQHFDFVMRNIPPAQLWIYKRG